MMHASCRLKNLVAAALLIGLCGTPAPVSAAKDKDKGKDKEAAPAIVEPGVSVRLLRDETLKLYDKPLRAAKTGETFEVLAVRASTGKVFLGVQEKGRLVAASAPLDAVEPAAKAAAAERILKSDALFAGLIPTIKITIAPADMEHLRKEPRSYVEATIEEVDGKVTKHAAVKLKGSAGSFQGVDARPGFSINCDKFKGAERFHGLKRFQLNNGAQDGTYLNEIICGEIARKAGVPASRCTHALVSLNGRELGTYVLKEGFTEEFLSAFFKRTDGNLYDGGFVSDVRADMELDRGDATQKKGLTELLGAINERDAAKQQARMAAIVDVDAYLRYLVLESLLCHWDGYSFNRNNYRVYEDPETGRFHFFLHGMDQMFGDTNWSMRRDPSASVGSVLWRNPAMRERYNVQLFDIYENVIKAVDWAARTEEIGQRLASAIEAHNPQAAKNYLGNINGARDRVRARMLEVRKQLEGNTLLKSLVSKGSAELGSGAWTAQMDNAQGQEMETEGRKCLYVRATGDSGGSWRLVVNAPAGKYRFEAQLKVREVQATQGSSGTGAGVRISGGNRQAPNALSGTNSWQKVGYEFNATGGDQTLVIELRAKSGEMWADRGSLRLVKVP